MMHKRYTKEQCTAAEAQRLAQEIAFGPVVFQVSRLMLKFGIFQLLSGKREGYTLQEISGRTGLTRYAAQVLLEASLTIGTILLEEDRYVLAKAGWFLLNDKMARVNMEFNHDVNYQGLFHLEEALLNGRPEGLKVFGEWPTIYEGLSQLPEQVQKSWFSFDHFYSDQSFGKALEIVFSHHPKRLLDIGGNTGRWATQCVQYNKEVEVTIVDLPQQLEMMRKQTAGLSGSERIHGHGANLLDRDVPFPTGFDAVWMSQFLDCFTEDQAVSILTRMKRFLPAHGRLAVLECLWDRQPFEAAKLSLVASSLYFTALANGNSRFFSEAKLLKIFERAGLTVESVQDGLGVAHTLYILKVAA